MPCTPQNYSIRYSVIHFHSRFLHDLFYFQSYTLVCNMYSCAPFPIWGKTARVCLHLFSLMCSSVFLENFNLKNDLTCLTNTYPQLQNNHTLAGKDLVIPETDPYRRVHFSTSTCFEMHKTVCNKARLYSLHDL